MKKRIDFEVKGIKYSIPNAWELLTPQQFEGLLALLNQMAMGELSVAMVQVHYVCQVMGWNTARIKDEASLQVLSILADQVTFIFNIEYPAGALDGISSDIQQELKKTPPSKIADKGIGRYLAMHEYKYVVDSIFCAQLLPIIQIGRKKYQGYKIDVSFDTLTCSLRALQYIEAKALLEYPEKLPLLCAILYLPGEYSSEAAHELAKEFAKLPIATLSAIAFCFQAFNNFLFTHTHFSLLTQGTVKQTSTIATGALESLYNLSADGLGNVNVVEQLNVIKYLTIIRKKLIDAVTSMNDAEVPVTDIEERTGLPLHIINNIIK